MTTSISPHERELLHSALVPQLDHILHDAGELEDVENVERMACELLVPFRCTDAPPEVVGALVCAVERSEAPAGVDLLAAFARLGCGELARAAAKARERQASDGRRSHFEDSIGRLEARAAVCVQDGAAEILQVRFERPDSGEHQLGALFLEREETGGAALGGLVTTPVSEPPSFLPGPDGAAVRTIGVDELRDRARTALARTAELELAVEHELGVCLPLLAIGITGSAEGLPAVDVDLPDPLDEEPEGDSGPLYVDPFDEDAYFELEEELLAELEEHLEGQKDASDHAHFFAGSLLQWKWGYADGRLGTWRCADVAEYMLDYAPRKLPSDDETLAEAPRCISAFLSFLAARGSLAGDPLDELIVAVERLGPRFAEAARDRSNWGPAKSLISQMQAEGVELTDQEALDAWLEDFNARPQAERERVLGPAPVPIGAGFAPAPTAGPKARERGRQAKTQRRGKRKQARAARKRNRR
jgi:hypothetical protein